MHWPEGMPLTVLDSSCISCERALDGEYGEDHQTSMCIYLHRWNKVHARGDIEAMMIIKFSIFRPCQSRRTGWGHSAPLLSPNHASSEPRPLVRTRKMHRKKVKSEERECQRINIIALDGQFLCSRLQPIFAAAVCSATSSSLTGTAVSIFSWWITAICEQSGWTLFVLRSSIHSCGKICCSAALCTSHLRAHTQAHIHTHTKYCIQSLSISRAFHPSEFVCMFLHISSFLQLYLSLATVSIAGIVSSYGALFPYSGWCVRVASRAITSGRLGSMMPTSPDHL